VIALILMAPPRTMPRGKCDNCVKVEQAAMSSLMSRNDRYTVATVRSGSSFSSWGCEVYRNGKPLPARLWDSGFKSEHTAKLAGNAALREFLSDLAREENKPD
jgi:hypothetical protein